MTDLQGDLLDYETLVPVTLTVPEADIQTTCFDAESHLVDTLPPEIAEQIAGGREDSLVLWTTLHAPVPITPTRLSYWLFALDTDADLDTGRPVGDGAINPDLGAELTAGIYSDPGSGIQFQPYLLVWDAAEGDMVRHAFAAELAFTPDRRTIILALPREPLNEVLVEVAQVVPRWEGIVGRAATLASSELGLVVDFCPNLPSN
ncbi:MAG: hypothetical protein ACP5GX_03030 [Anaerolineae bacterium]